MRRDLKTLFIGLLFVTISGLSLNGGAFCFEKMQNDALGSLLSHFSTSIPSDGDRRLAKGKFLVAARKLADFNFSQTVVLLIEYDQNGAVGVIINRPTEMKLSMVFKDIKELQNRGDTLFWGGPVMRSQLLMLVRTGARPDGSVQVLQDVYVASQLKLIEQMIENEEKGNRFRIYAGYAGWGYNQLDQEVKRGDWHILAADADTVFNKAPSEMWPELIHRSSLKFVRVRGKGE
jgi:putative transcriptional regulator